MNNKLELEFAERVDKLRTLMKERGIDACLIYGDEYRKENLRYISNYWPIFERGAVIVAMAGDPIVLAAPEGELVCHEMSIWSDIRLIPDFNCVTVPDEIEYPHAQYTDFKKVIHELKEKYGLIRLGIAGMDAMAKQVYESIAANAADVEIVDANELLFALRLKKSAYEIHCLKEAARIADEGYRALMEAANVGATELEIAAAAYYVCMREGAENVPFCLVSSGARVNTIIGRPTRKKVENGDMLMAALAVQFEGYVATINFPFVVGESSPEQREFINYLIEANDRALPMIRPGVRQGDMVGAVKSYFREQGIDAYDLYPPLHGCGVAEAEMPYPNESTTGLFEEGMTVNTDISLFGHPNGSNRIEEGFILTKEGNEPMSRLVRELTAKWKKTQR
ncbi:M24 family metallopeptidase [Paenibacillus sp. GCM10027626]|uniref:M24 family metallopeptidase n=1 Tax=Paenibacillus sp. GCM10027626 TaxID=3273411 RepID=UPI003634CD40